MHRGMPIALNPIGKARVFFSRRCGEPTCVMETVRERGGPTVLREQIQHRATPNGDAAAAPDSAAAVRRDTASTTSAPLPAPAPSGGVEAVCRD
jgi:hypothetical protein